MRHSSSLFVSYCTIDLKETSSIRLPHFPLSNSFHCSHASFNQATYAASTKSEKNKMSTKIVTKLINSYPPRRFLEKSESGIWQEVPLKRAVTKTSQALRDVARDRANKAAGVKKSTANPFVVKFSTPSSTLRHIRTVSNASILSATADTSPIDTYSSISSIIEPQQNADWPSAPPQPLQDGEQFETSVENLFLDDLNAGLFDDKLDPCLDDILDNAPDDTLSSFGLLDSNGADRVENVHMRKEFALM